MFRYSGNKKRLLKHLPGVSAPAPDCILEPFAGSLAYSLHYRPRRIVCADVNPKVRALWEWLRSTATQEDLLRLERLKPIEKVDVRTWGERHRLSEPEQTLLRLQISGAYVGQLSSWVLYPQHSLSLEEARRGLLYVQRALQPPLEDFRDPVLMEAAKQPRTVAFVDPPYLGTSANYKGKGDHGGIDPSAVTAFVKALPCPVLFTYGDGAKETFPEFDWQKAVTRKVPILRGGGTRERTEWFCTINWPVGQLPSTPWAFR